MGGLTATAEQQRFPYTCHRIVKVPTFFRLLLTSTSLTELNIYIKIQQKIRDKNDAIIVRKCGGLDVTTTNTTTTTTTTTTAAAAAIQVDFSHCLLKIKH
jgi:predicted acetyltransferase